MRGGRGREESDSLDIDVGLQYKTVRELKTNSSFAKKNVDILLSFIDIVLQHILSPMSRVCCSAILKYYLHKVQRDVHRRNRKSAEGSIQGTFD